MLLLLDFSRTFDTLDHNILPDRLSQRFGVAGHALELFTSYLSDRQQTVYINGCQSSQQSLRCSVPQGSVLGPVLFTLYTSPLGDIARHHKVSFHLYADDTQLYLSFKTEFREDMEQPMLIVEKCVCDIDTWKAVNKLKLNRDKTELLVLNAYHCPSPSLEYFAVSNEVITPSN